MKIKYIAVLAAIITLSLSGCSEGNTVSDTSSAANTTAAANTVTEENARTETTTKETAVSELTVNFGDDGEPFTMHLYDNETAAAIAYHVGTADWRLPIYHYDDYDGWEYFQFYDIPSRYEIPSNPEQVTSEKAGEVYYSEPNRIVLFYKDAEISGEYTKVGYFDYSDELLSAVENNPVLEGWGNKIVLISDN